MMSVMERVLGTASSLLAAGLLVLGGCAALPSEEQGETLRSGAEASQPLAFEDVRDKAAPAAEPRAERHSELETATQNVLERFDGMAAVAFLPVGATNDPGFNINGGVEHTSASMIKLVVLAEVFDQVSRGDLSLDELLTVEHNDIVGGSGVVQTMGKGVQLTIGDLARYMIAESDNVAANMLIDLVGMDAVNEEAANLGLAQTKLQRRMMDEGAAAQGLENLMSANDVAAVLASIAGGTFYSEDLSALALEFLEAQSDASGLLAGLPEGTMFAHKTGTLANVQNDGGIVEGDSPYVLVVLTQDMGSAQALDLMSEVAATISGMR